MEPTTELAAPNTSNTGTAPPKLHPFFSRDQKDIQASNNRHSLADNDQIKHQGPVAEEKRERDSSIKKPRGRPKKSAQPLAQTLDFYEQATTSRESGNVDNSVKQAPSKPTSHDSQNPKKSSRVKETDMQQQRLNFTSMNHVPSPPLSPNPAPREVAHLVTDPLGAPSSYSPHEFEHLVERERQGTPPSEALTPESGHINSKMASVTLQPTSCLPSLKSRSRSGSLSNVAEPPRKKHKASNSLMQLTTSAHSTSTSGSDVPEVPLLKPSLIVILKVHVPPSYTGPSLIVKLKVRVPESQPQPEKPKKPIHPFFSKGPAKTQKSETIVAAISTPAVKADNPTLVPNRVTDDSTGFKSDSKPKFQVEVEPPWPPAGAVHVRGLSPQKTDQGLADIGSFVLASKGKDKRFQLPESESLLRLMFNRLSSVERSDEDSTAHEMSPFLRIPERIELTATPLLKERLRSVLKARLSSSSLHPALRSLREIMADCEMLITQFDKCEPQTVAWTTKYAPRRTAEVLQVGKETAVLSEWLHKMKVWAVETANGKLGKKPESRHKEKKKKKRKRRNDGLDGFLVSDEEDDDTMDELTDPEDSPASAWGIKRPGSLIRRLPARSTPCFGTDEEDDDILLPSGDERGRAFSSREGSPAGKLNNVIVISGPSGVGKTAAVYAAALEHGFSVFEVNPGQKRGGKELMDLVGDMTKNHLVHKDKVLEPAELLSSSLGKLQPPIKEDKSKSQRQSLILIEEADILFEEDKQFWPTVFTLISESKRPVIITCNDEGPVPLDELPLQAVLRFSVPPKDLIVDYLLMLSAAEGHLLSRHTIENLHDQCNGDLRMSIMQLNFWCQMTVGDRTGGLKWSVKRWPPGVDMEEGEIVRCFSKNTYLAGMGQLGRELLSSATQPVAGTPGQPEDDFWVDVLENTGMDIGMKLFHDVGTITTAMGKLDSHMALRCYDSFADMYSAVDVFAGKELRAKNLDTFKMDILDPTHPPQNMRHEPDNVLGYTSLHTERRNPQSSTGRTLAIHARCSAFGFLQSQLGNDYIPSPRFSFTEMELSELVSKTDTSYSIPEALPEAQLRSPFEESLLPSENFFPPPNPGIYQFHQPLGVFTTDVAPFVREIARGIISRQQIVQEMGKLLSVGGGGALRNKRNTRTSRGRGRNTYLRGNCQDMVKTAGIGWENALEDLLQKDPLIQEESAGEDDNIENGDAVKNTNIERINDVDSDSEMTDPA